MKLNILVRTSDYRGERADPVAVAIQPKANETVDALANRVFAKKQHNACVDWIEIRLEQTY